MIKGEVTFNYYFGKIFFAYVIGQDLRSAERRDVKCRRYNLTKFILITLMTLLLLFGPVLSFLAYRYFFPESLRFDTF